LSDLFPLRNIFKQGEALPPLVFNFALEYAIRSVQVNQDGLKLNGTHQLLMYADDINIMGGSIHTIKKNAKALVAASEETGLEVNVNKTKYVVMFQDQNARQSNNINIGNSSSERMEEVIFRNNLTYQILFRKKFRAY
jgi:hypothetical protein